VFAFLATTNKPGRAHSNGPKIKQDPKKKEGRAQELPAFRAGVYKPPPPAYLASWNGTIAIQSPICFHEKISFYNNHF
jgi:hypothetical protein